MTDIIVGAPFHLVEESAVDVLGAVKSFTIAAHDPPWSSISSRVPSPERLVSAWDMELSRLEEMASKGVPGSVIVGFGGGTALDTAKFLSWKSGKTLIQIPTITSVDAGFTDAIGVRVDGKVRYIAKLAPQRVVLDLAIVGAAPKRLNRAGVGDVLSCHTGLWDWQLAVKHGEGHPWRDDLANLGRQLLDRLFAAAVHFGEVDDEAIRLLARSYQRIGAACAEARHSRFEEGSEHFWAYAYEHLTGAHPVHGEIIAFATVLMSFLQGNEPERVRDFVNLCHVQASPADLGIERAHFDQTFASLKQYVRRENLDFSIIDVLDWDDNLIDAAWEFVQGIHPISSVEPIAK